MFKSMEFFNKLKACTAMFFKLSTGFSTSVENMLVILYKWRTTKVENLSNTCHDYFDRNICLIIENNRSII